MPETLPTSQITLPSGLKVHVHNGERGLIMTVPPERAIKFPAIAGIGSVLLLVVSAVLFHALTFSVQLSRQGHAVRFALAAIVILVIWIFWLNVMRRLLKYKLVPTVIAVGNGKLIVVAPGIQEAGKQFDIDSQLSLHVHEIGVTSNRESRGELVVNHGSETLLSLFYGKNSRDIDWIVKGLDTALNAERDKL
jgi:hypothetical protein